jgi:mannose-1-phosphate guanylyltransferase
MFPVANKPIIEWILEGLSQHGVTEAVLAVNYMADMLERHLGRSKHGIDLLYSHEKKPLGTGGPIKKAEDLLSDGDGLFYVLNGDVLSSINYGSLMQAHRDAKALATIALQVVADPSRFGVVEMTPTHQILKFVEKPKAEDAPSNLINAGVYALSNAVFELIPEGKKVSMEYDVFPILVGKGKLYGRRFDGLWVDVGKPDDYIRANRLMLSNLAKEAPLVEGDARINETATIIPPVVIGPGAVIEEDTCIGPYVAIGKDSEVSRGARIEDSVIFDRAWIDNHASVRGAIIGEGAIVGRWVKVESDCIVGDHAILTDNVTLTSRVKICPSKEVKASVLSQSTIM